MRIKVLRDRKVALLAEADGLNAKLDANTATETEKDRAAAITAKGGDLDKLNASIAAEERLMDERRSMTPVHSVNEDTPDETRARVQTPAPPKFKTMGEQLQAIAFAGQKGTGKEEWDRRLVPLYQPGGIQGAASGANESIPSEGGFLVQQDIAAPMIESMFQGGEILKRVRRRSITSGANGVIIPALDESSRANGSRWGGVQVYFADEADTVTATKPKFRNMNLRLNKLMGLAYATDELLADQGLLEAIFGDAFREEMTFKAEDTVLNGTGSGQPLGILNSGALISVTADSGQAAATVSAANVLNMFNRLPPRSMTRAVWLVNQGVIPQLQQMTLASGTAVVRLYQIPGDTGANAAAAGGGVLLGRPVIPVEQAAALGTVGDIILVDLDQYLLIDKGGINQASSIHVRFIYDEMTFRWVYRLDGQPMQRTAITAFKGSNSISPYIALTTRS